MPESMLLKLTLKYLQNAQGSPTEKQVNLRATELTKNDLGLQFFLEWIFPWA